jgi:predicted DNA-binding protein
MSFSRISIRISESLRNRLAEQAAVTGRPQSELVREALQEYLARRDQSESAYETARKLGLIGCVTDAPPDLSTNPRYFEGFPSSTVTRKQPRRKRRA